jgi:hypothetical protein
MADLRNFAEWDPGVSSAVLSEGSEPGLDAVYDVAASGTKLRYRTVEFESPVRMVAEAVTKRLRSYDVIEVEAHEDGSKVAYDATLELNGPAKILDPVLGLFFDRIGDRAADGLAKALDGSLVS